MIVVIMITGYVIILDDFVMIAINVMMIMMDQQQ